MPQPLALSPKDFQGKRWQPPTNHSHLQTQALLPLHAGELAQAAASMPLALIKQGAQWQLVAVCGQHAGHNLFIKDGRWLGSYQPVWLSTYPFQTVSVGDKVFVTFEQDSGLLSEQGGEPFFDEAGQPTPAVAKRIEALKAHMTRQAATHRVVAALAQAGVLSPWPQAFTEAVEINIDGLHMVDENALAQLPDAVFLGLRQVQALSVAYGVNFSVQQSHLLLRLARLQAGVGVASQTQAFDQLLNATDALAVAKPGKGKNGQGMNGRDSEDLNWSL